MLCPIGQSNEKPPLQALDKWWEHVTDLWKSYSAPKQLQLWWDNIPIAFDITKVGKVLAHTNAKRCDPELPDLL